MINRNKYRNKSKSKNREHRENEISHEKTQEFENNNFINFSKTSCFKYCKKEHYVRNCIAFEFATLVSVNSNSYVDLSMQQKDTKLIAQQIALRI